MGITDSLPVTHDGVLLRPLAEIDAEAYAAGTKDPTVRRYAHLPLPEYTPETVRDLARGEVRKGLESGRLAVLSILDATTEAFFGSLVLFDVTEHEAEVGFWLSPHARGHGVARRPLPHRPHRPGEHRVPPHARGRRFPPRGRTPAEHDPVGRPRHHPALSPAPGVTAARSQGSTWVRAASCRARRRGNGARCRRGWRGLRPRPLRPLPSPHSVTDWSTVR